MRAIQSTRVVRDGMVGPGRVVIDGESVKAVTAPDGDTDGLEIEDVGDAVVMPGIVDPHVHVNEPGRTEWEGFATATRAAAAGGVTSFVDMPLNCIPVTTTADALRIKLEACASSLHVDVGFWGGVVPGNAGELAGLARGGALGCKAFMVDSGIPEFEWSRKSDLLEAMPHLRDAGLPLLAHAELDLGAVDVSGDDPRSYASYLRSRPRAWEDAAIALLLELCEATGCPVHVVHLSSADALDALRDAKDRGLPVTVETCAHYLCLRAEDVPDGETRFKCAPPIREDENRLRLWSALEEGLIDFVVTDHSPCTPHLKLPERGDFHAAWGGIASLQLGLPSVWSQARARGTSLPDLSRWLSTNGASFAGLGRRKGQLTPGFDADIVVWDPDAAWTVRTDDLRFRHPVSPYVGEGLFGRVLQTILRGTTIFSSTEAADSTTASAPHGRPLLGRDSA